jgi:chitinase
MEPLLQSDPGTVYEGDDGQRRAQFFVHLSRAPLSNVTISYSSADGSATAPGDYVAKLPGTVVFAPGQISKTIDVLVNSDGTAGSNREFLLEVAVTGGSPVEEINMTGISTIIDDD